LFDQTRNTYSCYGKVAINNYASAMSKIIRLHSSSKVESLDGSKTGDIVADCGDLIRFETQMGIS
jgi:hypothetical protein